MSFEDEVLRTEREMGRHHGAREDLSDAISDLRDEVRSYDFDDQSDVADEFERFARTVGDYLENDRAELEDDRDELEDILGDIRGQRRQTYGNVNFNGIYMGGWNAWTGQQQQQSMGWGNMYQSQGHSGQYQSMGWPGMWQTQRYEGQQQQSQGQQDWFQEFWGQQGDDDLLEDSEEDDPGDEPVTVVDETADEDDDYTEPEDTGYDESDGGDPDGSVDTGTTFGPSNFDYSGGQELDGATQNFDFSGSGMSISGSVTMEQSVSGEDQYFEASF